MRIAFLISRTPEYRIYGPVIEAALARGWDVECWHDHGQSQTGLKGYQFPSLDIVPVFRNGRPAVRSFQGRAELRSWLAELRTDAVVAFEPASVAVDLPLPAPRPLWVEQQYRLDSFVMHRPDQVLACDLFSAYSRWWIDWVGEYYEAEGTVSDGDRYVRDLAARTAIVGLPELDAVHSIEPAEVRRRWQISADQPVVVLFLFAQGVGRETFWPRQICAEPSPLKQLASIARRGRLEYLPHVGHGWNDVNVVKALRGFCDRNGAYLLVKARRKTPVPAYTEALADRCVYDESFYPATVLEALSIASLSVGYYTTSVFESVSQGVHHLCFTYDGADYNGPNANFFDRFYSPEQGSPYQCRGVTTAWSIPEALTRLPGATLSDFTMDRQARTDYVRKFLTHDGGDVGERLVAAIADALGRRARPA